MTTIGVRELRRNASRYLAVVEAGEELDVTNNGRLVARIVPVPQASRSLETLISAGVLVPPRNPRRLSDIRPRPAIGPGEPTLSAILDEMRNEE